MEHIVIAAVLKPKEGTAGATIIKAQKGTSGIKGRGRLYKV
ncbi:hypothetical protein OC195_01320 [Priestia flexa]|nr:hypothetical protein OC195_01320 [Priestia flexa]